jgi:hypothetical protein
MLDGTKNCSLYGDWLDYIVDASVKQAFLYLLGLAATSTRYSCHIQRKGEIRDFRFHDAGDEQPHSFITNQHWLLFYFRPPAVRSGRYSRDAIAADFDSFEETPAGEWHVKLRSIADVERLVQHVRLRHS